MMPSKIKVKFAVSMEIDGMEITMEEMEKLIRSDVGPL